MVSTNVLYVVLQPMPLCGNVFGSCFAAPHSFIGAHAHEHAIKKVVMPFCQQQSEHRQRHITRRKKSWCKTLRHVIYILVAPEHVFECVRCSRNTVFEEHVFEGTRVREHVFELCSALVCSSNAHLNSNTCSTVGETFKKPYFLPDPWNFLLKSKKFWKSRVRPSNFLFVSCFWWRTWGLWSPVVFKMLCLGCCLGVRMPQSTCICEIVLTRMFTYCD